MGRKFAERGRNNDGGVGKSSAAMSVMNKFRFVEELGRSSVLTSCSFPKALFSPLLAEVVTQSVSQISRISRLAMKVGCSSANFSKLMVAHVVNPKLNFTKQVWKDWL
jgi:hypothetical protein